MLVRRKQIPKVRKSAEDNIGMIRETERERREGILRAKLNMGWLHTREEEGDSFSIIVVLQQSLLGKRKLCSSNVNSLSLSLTRADAQSMRSFAFLSLISICLSLV
jgi:hypothetical protein